MLKSLSCVGKSLLLSVIVSTAGFASVVQASDLSNSLLEVPVGSVIDIKVNQTILPEQTTSLLSLSALPRNGFCQLGFSASDKTMDMVGDLKLTLVEPPQSGPIGLREGVYFPGTSTYNGKEVNVILSCTSNVTLDELEDALKADGGSLSFSAAVDFSE